MKEGAKTAMLRKEHAIRSAINGLKTVQFRYEGDNKRFRIVEPYALGVAGNGSVIVWCYQLGGPSATGTTWKLFRVDKMRAVKVRADTFVARPEYREATGPQMALILAQVKKS